MRFSKRRPFAIILTLSIALSIILNSAISISAISSEGYLSDSDTVVIDINELGNTNSSRSFTTILDFNDGIHYSSQIYHFQLQTATK